MSSSSPHLSPQRHHQQHHHHHQHHRHQLQQTDRISGGAPMAQGSKSAASNSDSGPQQTAVVSSLPTASACAALNDDQQRSAAGATAALFARDNLNHVAACCSGDALAAKQTLPASAVEAGPGLVTATLVLDSPPVGQKSISQVTSNNLTSADAHQRPQQHPQQQQPPTPSHHQKQQATGNMLTMINPDTRTHVVGELFDTERSYVESLQILVEKYMRPLKSQDSNKSLIDSNLVDEIFFTIPEILAHHENFLNALQERLNSDWDSSQVIGNLFIQAFTNQQIIDIYTKFINNWKNARQAIKVAIQAKPAFEKFLESMSREHRNKLTLDALLIMPVQRIPRYELLIKELIKHTPQDHPDHGPLMEAQRKIHELALKIDRAEKEMLHQERLKDLEALIENHAGLIQHPQRDFIRYDLVTISTSTLTVTKKERVLFLFCDLLIMTSVKKKVSRRSNLQAAFANSDHDVGLLEGNKFKLILRLSLDQVDIRCDDSEQAQLWQQQQQLHEQKLLALAKHNKLVQDRKRELESDLLILQQMKLLSGQLTSRAELASLDLFFDKSIGQIVAKLNSLDVQPGEQLESYPDVAPSMLPAQDSYLVQATSPAESAAPSTSAPQQNSQSSGSLSQAQTGAREQPPNAHTDQEHQSSSSKQSDATLEFVITNNEVPTKELTSVSSNSSSKALDGAPEQQQSGSGQNLVGAPLAPSDGPQQNCETLVVSFPSRERRQAFVQAFLGAKQQRLKQQQRRMFSSSVTLKLSQPEQPLMKSRSIASDMRRNRLQHQDEVLETRANIYSNTNSLEVHLERRADNRNSSAPCSNATARCASGSSNNTLDSLDKMQANRHGGHHHHQLMHQPASHPALLHTICCHEQHNDSGHRSARSLNDEAELLVGPPESRLAADGAAGASGLAAQSWRPLNEAGPASMSVSEGEMARCNQILMLKFVPRFLTAMPLNFLNTQHPALQLSGAVMRKAINTFAGGAKRSSIFELGDRPIRAARQTVCDNRGQLWLCMSNGYVSHIALIEFALRECDSNDNPAKRCMNIVPIVKTGGDICKAQITCAAQVGWSVSRQNSRNIFGPSALNVQSGEPEFAKVGPAQSTGGPRSSSKPPEVSIKSASPPIGIDRQAECMGDKLHSRLMSRSAPANEKIGVQDGVRCSRLSASTTGPLRASDRASMPPREVAGQGAGECAVERERQRSAQRRTTSHRHQQHHHSQDQLRCRNPKCNLSLSCSQVSHRRYKVPASNSSGPRASNQLLSQQLHSHSLGANPQQGHPHQHHHLHHHHHHVYGNKHHTVPLAELRRALERQTKAASEEKDRLSLPDGGHASQKRLHLAPPANTPNPAKADSLDLADATRARCKTAARSSTPPGRNVSAGTRTKQLRHQASLKTSAILAKLVSSAGKGSSYLKRSANQSARAKADPGRRQSDLDDNDADGDQQNAKNPNQADNASSAGSAQSIGPPQQASSSSAQNAATSVVSPLSSGSSLNSSNSSSMTVNSVCISTPMHGSCARLLDEAQFAASSMCCAGNGRSFLSHHHSASSRDELTEAGETGYHSIRSRSATVPCRAYCEPLRPVDGYSAAASECPPSARQCRDSDERLAAYKVNDILDGPDQQHQNNSADEAQRSTCFDDDQPSLWLGCEDGSLIIIDCLTTANNQSCGVCNESVGSNKIPVSTCQNVHSELKLGAPISDIKSYRNKKVFVALADGQLVVFSRAANNDGTLANWQLESPQILAVAGGEPNQSSKLCLVDDSHLWYAYGRNIHILNVATLSLETTIATPADDKPPSALQSVAVENMEAVPQLDGVWVSFRGSPLIQFYASRGHKLLLEMSLLEPVGKVLACGSDLARQHKTASLATTSLLSLFNETEDCNSLFIGTSAGLILVLTVSQRQLRELAEAERPFWSPQVISLRHGHCGQVRFLQMVELERDAKGNVRDEGARDDGQRGSLILVSGGSGVDLYGPSDVRQGLPQEDGLSHLVLWSI